MSENPKERVDQPEPASDGATPVAQPSGAGGTENLDGVSADAASVQTHKEALQEPYYRVELRIHCVGEGREIPLGTCRDDGEWSPCEFVAATALGEMAPLDVANWLAGIDLMGMPVFDSVEEALAAVMDTRQRCLLACRSAADDDHAVKEAGPEQHAGGPPSN